MPHRLPGQSGQGDGQAGVTAVRLIRLQGINILYMQGARVSDPPLFYE